MPDYEMMARLKAKENQKSVGVSKDTQENAGTTKPKKEPQEQKKEKPQEKQNTEETKEAIPKKTEEKPAHIPRDSKRTSKVDGRRVSTNTTGIATIPWEGKFD